MKSDGSKLNRLLALLLSVLLLLAVITPASGAASQSADEGSGSGASATSVTAGAGARVSTRSPDPGVYRIKSATDGLYLDAGTGNTKLSLSGLKSSSDSQIFILERVEGSSCGYYITPCSICENADYTHRLSASGSVSGEAVYPVPKSRSSAQASFDIIMLKDGTYTIAPSDGDNLLAVLAAPDSGSSAMVADYIHGDSDSSWILEPVPSERVTFSFSFTRLKTGSTGRFFARFYPYGFDSRIADWSSSDDGILRVDGDGNYRAVSPGTVVVTASCPGTSGSFTVEVTDRSAFTFYSQNSMFGSDWDASMLDRLYFWGSGYRRIFAIDDKISGGESAWINTGCSICSFAMVLHNMDARLSTGYDFRSGQRDMLPADPYTVALANTGNYGALEATDVLYGNPVYASWTTIAGAFEVDGQALTIRRVYSGSRQVIKDLLDAHPQGIVALLSRGNRSHYVVLSRCLNPDAESAYQYDFEFYDPAGYYRENGDGVVLNSTTSALYLHYSYASIAQLIVIDTPQNINK